MDDRLNDFQLDIVRDFLTETLERTSSAMGQMLRMRVKSELIGFGEGRWSTIEAFDHLGQFRVHVMKVSLKGPVGGAFYFLINSHEVETINNNCLPKQMEAATNSENRQIKYGFISEIENTIAAMATTEISEFLGVQLFGMVPETSVIQGKVVNDFLRAEARANNANFYVRSIMKGINIDVAPHFVWMLDDEFKNILKLNTVS
jgi:chemotaxis protein CheY-P-specific phosphatase CheC